MYYTAMQEKGGELDLIDKAIEANRRQARIGGLLEAAEIVNLVTLKQALESEPEVAMKILELSVEIADKIQKATKG